MLQTVKQQTITAVTELLDMARLQPGDVLVVGCSSSEITGQRIGTGSSMDTAAVVVDALLPVLEERGVALAAQCCEHLNRALIVEAEVACRHGWPVVNVLPQPKAGGSFATTVWQRMKHPVAVEQVVAQAGMDIGGTLIGMHLQPVAVPVRLSLGRIGEALLLCARTRPKFVGGSRAVYNEELL
ncbi:MAG: TIGR01440 family protein [Clostridia bacterium]|nr:TIGR01440 family protein [Clostridia bacterium]